MLDETFYQGARTHMQRSTNNVEDLCKLVVDFTELAKLHPEYQAPVLRFLSLCENLTESLIAVNLDIIAMLKGQIEAGGGLPWLPPDSPADTSLGPESSLPEP
jgi:hypothetical protein